MRRLAWNPARRVRVDFNDYTFVVPCVSGEGDVVVFYKVGGGLGGVGADDVGFG